MCGSRALVSGIDVAVEVVGPDDLGILFVTATPQRVSIRPRTWESLLEQAIYRTRSDQGIEVVEQNAHDWTTTRAGFSQSSLDPASLRRGKSERWRCHKPLKIRTGRRLSG